MTIRTQQLEVACVLPPIFEAASPCISGLGSELRSGVDVVNVQCSVIIEPAANALATQGFNQGKFAFPVLRVLVDGGSILIPISLLAFVGAITNVARFAAILTRAVTLPAVRQVALLAAIFTRTLAKSICVHLFRLPAACADDRDGLLSHGINIAQEPKYFDIACRRISDALRQPDMFIEKPKPIKPASEASLFDPVPVASE